MQYVLAGPQQLGLCAILLKLDCESELGKKYSYIVFNMNLEAVVAMFIFKYFKQLFSAIIQLLISCLFMEQGL